MEQLVSFLFLGDQFLGSLSNDRLQIIGVFLQLLNHAVHHVQLPAQIHLSLLIVLPQHSIINHISHFLLKNKASDLPPLILTIVLMTSLKLGRSSGSSSQHDVISRNMPGSVSGVSASNVGLKGVVRCCLTNSTISTTKFLLTTASDFMLVPV